MNQKLLSIEQAAKFLGCSVDQIRKLNVSGQLPAFNIGVGNSRRCLRIDEAELQAFLERRTSKPPSSVNRRRSLPKPKRNWLEDDA